MTTLGIEKYTFEVDWHDTQADIIRKYRVLFYPVRNEIEMFDVKLNRIFLKKVEIPSVSLDDFFVGAQVTVLSRVLRVTDYGDVHTRKRFEVEKSRTFAMIKPDAYVHMGKIIDAISNDGFAINKIKMSKFNAKTASTFYKEHEGKPFFPALQGHMTSDVVIGLELVAHDAVKKWRTLLGPTNTEVAKKTAPGSLRAMFGTDGTKNACHGSDSAPSYKRESEIFFGGSPSTRMMQTTAMLNNSTLCLIKPHIVKEGKLGQLIDMILSAGFEISAMEMFNLSRPVIEEFYDVYKGVLPEYLPVIEHFSNGPVVALEIR